MAKKQRPWLDLVVFILVRSLIALIQALPFSMGMSLARVIAWLAYQVDRRHRRVALQNLESAFGDEYSDVERDRLVRRVYEHFARMIVEMVWIPRRLTVRNWKRYASLKNQEDAVRLFMEHRPTIIVTGHFGNWEMAGFLLAGLGLKSYAIARDLDNPYLHRYLLRFRQWTGQTILSKTGDFERIQKALVDRRVLIMVGDQSAGPRGYFVDFFGRPASTHKSIAILSMQYDAPIVVGCARRDREGFHYEVSSSSILDPRDYQDRGDGAWAMTRDFTALLEEVIRRSPEQYLWLHNRWKHVPPARVGGRRAA